MTRAVQQMLIQDFILMYKIIYHSGTKVVICMILVLLKRAGGLDRHLNIRQ